MTTLTIDRKLAKRVAQCSEGSGFASYVRVKTSRRRMVLRTQSRMGTTGDWVEVAPRFLVSAGMVTVQSSNRFWYGLYWLTHSLDLPILLALAAGTTLTGWVAISTTVTGSGPDKSLVVPAWLGLGLSAGAILVDGVRRILRN